MELYSRGNAVFVEGGSCRVEGALALYEKALEQLRQGGGEEASAALRLKILSNCALCHLSLRNYQETISYCDKALSLDSSNLKAIIRRSKAHEQLGNFVLAIEDINRSLQIFRSDPDNKFHPLHNPRPVSAAEREAVARLLSLQRLAALDLQAQQRELNLRPASFVTASQTLSLRFGSDSLPASLRTGRLYSLRLCVSNEFGLWSRENMTFADNSCSRDTPKVCCEVLSVPLSDQMNPQQRKQHPSVAAPCSTGLSLYSLSINTIGENGRVDYTFRVERTGGASECCTCVMLKFFCDAPLASGQVVSPIVSLPIFVHAEGGLDHLAATGTENVKSNESTGCSKCAGDGNSDSVRHILSLCSEMSGQSIKIFEPFRPEQKLPTAAVLHPVRSSLIYALECPGSLGIGGKVWDATYGLLEFFADQSCEGGGGDNISLLSGRVVVELGSGTGLAGLGLCSALSSCLPPLQVILTDMMEVVPLLQVNISLNQVMHGGGRNIYQSYMALKHSWGDSVDDLNAAVASSSSSSSFSACSYRGLLLVASDVVYDPAGYRPLVTSIAALLLHHQALYLHQETRRKERPEENSSSVQPPLMVLAHRHRNPENMKFFEMLSAETSGLHVEKQDIQWKRTPKDVELYIIRPLD